MAFMKNGEANWLFLQDELLKNTNMSATRLKIQNHNMLIGTWNASHNTSGINKIFLYDLFDEVPSTETLTKMCHVCHVSLSDEGFYPACIPTCTHNNFNDACFAICRLLHLLSSVPTLTH